MSSTKTSQPRRLRKANEAVIGPVVPPRLLFDEFWREGEVALLFGSHGVGKSLLAVRIAEALARGQPVPGLEMPETPRNVLYVDLVLSDDQFVYRYSIESGSERHKYKFSEGLYRDFPDEDEDIVKWLREIVEKEEIKVIVIDDLSMVSNTDDGTRQTLDLVRELRRMARRLGISALVLADSQPLMHNREDEERDLRRRRILCAYADSVFALSTIPGHAMYHLVQTRSQAGGIAWPRTAPAHFRLSTSEDGFVGLDFVEADMSETQRQLVCQIKHLHDREEKPWTFREIANHLGISKSTVARFYQRWRPSLEPKPVPQPKPAPPKVTGTVEYSREDLERYGFDPDRPRADHISNVDGRNDPTQAPVQQDPVPTGPQWHLLPFAAALARRSIHDLERTEDAHGNEIFVESREEYTGKPKVWYKRQKPSGNYRRYERNTWGVSGQKHGPSPLLPREPEIRFQTTSRAPPNQSRELLSVLTF